MKYDFDRIIDRTNSDSVKWKKGFFGPEDVIPLWIADLDFQAPQPVVDALKARAAHPVYGYGYTGESLARSIVDRMEGKYGWKIARESILYNPGVVPAIRASVMAFAGAGDAVIFQTPAYPPFFSSAKDAGRKVVENPLKWDGARWDIDFDDLEAKMAEHHPKVIILCNAHNPVGRVWTREELLRIGEIALRYGAIVVSDEIHGEIVYPGHEYIPFCALSPEIAERSIVCTSPGKTFSLTGMAASITVVPNKDLRERYIKAAGGLTGNVSVFGYIAMETAYRDGDDWLGQVLKYLEGNVDLLMRYFEEKIPRIKVARPDGTFLAWLDCRSLGMDPKSLHSFWAETAGVGFTHGDNYGAPGFERLNFGCPRSVLEEGLRRIERAVSSLGE